MEELDPDISHFEFFLSRGPLIRQDWTDPAAILAASGAVNPCLWGWPSTDLLGPDLTPLSIEPEGLALMKALAAVPSGTSIAQLPIEAPAEERASIARRLWEQKVLLLSS